MPAHLRPSNDFDIADLPDSPDLPDSTNHPDFADPMDDVQPPKPKRTIPRPVFTALMVILGCLLVFGVIFSVAAFRVLGKMDTAKAQAAALEQSLLNGEADQARVQTSELTGTLTSMRDSVHGIIWDVASFFPLIGRDVSNAQTLADCACDLSQNALTPLVNEIAGMRLADLVVEHSVNTEMLGSMRASVVAVSPVLVTNAQTISSLQPGIIGPINDKLTLLRNPLSDASELLKDADHLFGMALDMLGDGGQTRTYVLLAQTNAEIRAGGGFPGSVGMVNVTNGYAELSEFHSVSEIQGIVRGNGLGAQISPDEMQAFGEGLSNDAASVTYTPDFVRSGQIAQQQWSAAYGTSIDGLIAMDPVFLQRILALTGGVVAFDGMEVNGENAAPELLHNVYLRYGYDEGGGDEEDLFFNDVAHKSFSKLLDTMGEFNLEAFSALWNTIRQSGDDRRFQVWMANGEQEAFVRDMGVSGAIQSDVAAPELGVYVNDNTWSKICWYLDVSTDLGAPQQNADGTTTYHVTSHFRNTISPEAAAQDPDYVTGYNPLKRDRSDMIETIYLMAPMGATITDYVVNRPSEIAADALLPDDHLALYGRDTWHSRIQILAGEDVTISYTLTMPAGVGAPTVCTSPSCHG